MRVRQSASARSADTRLRGALLMPVCALAVHQLRFYLAFGGATQRRLAHEGHAYLGTVEPLALLAASLAAGALVGRLARRWQTGHEDPRSCPSGLRVWALCAATLLAIYCGQELVEGCLAAGHPAGLAGIVGHGGWLALPLALAVAAALALALRLAHALIVRVACRRRPRRRAAALSAAGRISAAIRDWRLDPGSGVTAGRAPPPAVAL